MILDMLAFMSTGASVPAVSPSVTAVSVELQDSGTCSGTHVGTSAKIRVTPTISNGDTVNFTYKVYKDGVLQGSANSGYRDNTVGGYCADVGGHGFTSAYVFRVDVVRNSDSAVVSTKTAATFRQEFGDCSGGV